MIVFGNRTKSFFPVKPKSLLDKIDPLFTDWLTIFATGYPIQSSLEVYRKITTAWNKIPFHEKI